MAGIRTSMAHLIAHPAVPWSEKWTKMPSDPSTSVEITAHSLSAEDDMVFFFPRNLLIASCEYFSTTLSPEWSGQGQQAADGKASTRKANWADLTAATSQASSLGASVATTAHVDNAIDTGADPLPSVSGTITLFVDCPWMVHYLLIYIDPESELILLPQTVEMILQLADMIGYDALVQECKQFLLDSITSSLVNALDLGEGFRLKEVYELAAKQVLCSDEFMGARFRHRLSEDTAERLGNGQYLFWLHIWDITLKDLKSRVENKCSGCGLNRTTNLDEMRRALRAAVNARPGYEEEFLSVVRHTADCPGPVETRNLIQIVELDESNNPPPIFFRGQLRNTWLRLPSHIRKKAAKGTNIHVLIETLDTLVAKAQARWLRDVWCPRNKDDGNQHSTFLDRDGRFYDFGIRS